MNELHNCGLVRFSKKTGIPDLTMTALGQGLIKLWALQNTTKTKVCVIVDIDARRTVAEYIGTADGFPEIRDNEDAFEYDIPDELYAIFEEEAAKRAATV